MNRSFADIELSLHILRYAESAPNQRTLAQKVGYSVGKVNYVLSALIDKGLIKAERFIASNNKIKYRYILTPEGLREKIALTEAFIERKKREYEELVEELEITRTKGVS
ncbi:MAG: MarR family EPS-associated transcriptional regulator [Campylobacterales bacterium]